MKALLVLFAVVLAFSGLSYAMDCATSAYSQSCEKCSFLSNGKMGPICYNEWQEWGKKCIAEKRPFLASKYNEGKCPAIDACAAELESCKSAVSTGNDYKDCLNPLVGVCFVEADACVAKAEEKCTPNVKFIDDLLNSCPLPVFAILSIPLAAFLFARRK